MSHVTAGYKSRKLILLFYQISIAKVDYFLSLIAEVNSKRTNLSPFTKGYRGLASLFQCNSLLIYVRRLSLWTQLLFKFVVELSDMQQIKQQNNKTTKQQNNNKKNDIKSVVAVQH